MAFASSWTSKFGVSNLWQTGFWQLDMETFAGLPQVHEGFSQAGDVFVHAPGYLRLSMSPERRVSPHAVQQCRTALPWQRSLWQRTAKQLELKSDEFTNVSPQKIAPILFATFFCWEDIIESLHSVAYVSMALEWKADEEIFACWHKKSFIMLYLILSLTCLKVDKM